MVEKIKLKCNNCNTEFYKYPCQLKEKNGIKPGRFCSKKCMDDSRKHGEDLTCKMCGVVFYRRAGEQKGTKLPFCSLECVHNYRLINAKKTTYLKEGATHKHIVIAEKALKRKLKKGEIVHHIDENKHNNKIENLAILPSQSVHAKVHFNKISGFNIDKYRLINIIKA